MKSTIRPSTSLTHVISQLLITDGESFCHEEKRDLRHEIRYPERNCLHYRLTNSDPAGRYRIVKHVLADPHRSVVLMRVRLEVAEEALRGKLKLYALLAPHLLRGGADNSGWVCEFAGRRLFHVARENVHLSFGCEPDFMRRSVGYVGASDGWRDLMDNFRMDWEFRAAEGGNIALDRGAGLFARRMDARRSRLAQRAELCDQAVAVPGRTL